MDTGTGSTMEGLGMLRLAQWISRLLLICALFSAAAAYPLCRNMAAPVASSRNLSFCSSTKYSSRGCCSFAQDHRIQTRFRAMNITDTACASVVKQILCSECDSYSADLYGYQSEEPRDVPYLCNTDQSSNLTTETGRGYCHSVWDACSNASIADSPFSPVLQGNPGSPSPSSSSSLVKVQTDIDPTQSTLQSIFASEADFCSGFGPSIVAGNFCFSGVPFMPPPAANFTPPEGVCLEKISAGAYLNMVPHPDGSNRVIVTNQAGVIWLATVPEAGQLVLNDSAPFLDISDRVIAKNELGFLGFAFHPDFQNNGRFFVSYNCDKQQWDDCGGRCACNDDTDCNPQELQNGQVGGDGGTDPCRYSSIVAEYSVNMSSNPAASPFQAETANPAEVRRIFTMALPYSTHHAGQILFGLLDKFLYFMMGDGGNTGDPFNFAQNKKSLLGKIMRLDVDNLPTENEVSNQGLWGQYSIPSSNPFVKDNNSRPEIWAYGLRNPWRCSFDTQHPTYMYCGDVGQEKAEEVNLISMGGNYGWRVYEGNFTYVPPLSPGGNTTAASIQPISPILSYLHSDVAAQEGYAAITGGYVSYSQEDACLYGKYMYADLYGTVFVGEELPLFSGNYKSARVSYQCSANSPLSCTFAGNSTVPSLQPVVSFGQDNSNNMFVLSENGVYRVTSPSKCNFQCSEALPELPTPPVSGPGPVYPGPSPGPSASSAHTTGVFARGTFLLILFVHFFLMISP